jgi:hypothetical protein
MKIVVKAAAMKKDKPYEYQDGWIWLDINGVIVHLKQREEKTIYLKESYDDNIIQFEETLEKLTQGDKALLHKFYEHVASEYTGPYILAQRFQFDSRKASELLNKGVLADIFRTTQRGKKLTERGASYVKTRIQELEELFANQGRGQSSENGMSGISDISETGIGTYSSSTPEVDKAVERFTPKLKKK